MKKSENNIIIISFSRRDLEYSSTSLCLAEEFSIDNNVYFINHPITISEFVFNFLKSKKLRRLSIQFLFGRNTYKKIQDSNQISIIPPLTIPVNKIPPSALYVFLQRINSVIIRYSIKQIIRKFQLEKYIFLNIHDPYYLSYFHKSFAPLLTVYYSVDDMSQESFTATHGVLLEEIASEKSDLVLTTSFKLHEKLSRFNPNVQILNNAVNPELFNLSTINNQQIPNDIKVLKKPIIGYVGNLDDTRVDFSLLKLIAEKFKDLTLLLIGPINSTKYRENGLDRMKNVVSLGSKNINELTAYLRQIDVAIIPFNLNQLTASIYPLKINEYLAVGKKVISTNFSKDINLFDDVISIAISSKDFLEKTESALSKACTPDQIKKRHEVAMGNTWKSRVNQFWTYVEDSINKQNG